MHLGWTRLFIAIVAAAGSGGAAAMGFGPIRSTVVLGQALNFGIFLGAVKDPSGAGIPSEIGRAHV